MSNSSNNYDRELKINPLYKWEKLVFVGELDQGHTAAKWQTHVYTEFCLPDPVHTAHIQVLEMALIFLALWMW